MISSFVVLCDVLAFKHFIYIFCHRKASKVNWKKRDKKLQQQEHILLNKALKSNQVCFRYHSFIDRVIHSRARSHIQGAPKKLFHVCVATGEELQIQLSWFLLVA